MQKRNCTKWDLPVPRHTAVTASNISTNLLYWKLLTENKNMFHRLQHNTEDLTNEANSLTTAAIQTASKHFNVPQKKSLQNTGGHTCHSRCWQFPDCSSPLQSSCPSYAALEGTQLHTSQTRLSCLYGTPLILKHSSYFVSIETQQHTCKVLITNSVPDHNNTNCTITLDRLHLWRSGNSPYHQV